MEQCGLDLGRPQRQAGGLRLDGPAAGIIVERPQPADRVGLGVVGLQMSTVERPAGVAHARSDLEVDRVEGAGRPGVVAWSHPVARRPAERPNPRTAGQIGWVADALATVEPLGAALDVLSATFEQAHANAVANEL